MNTGTLTEKDGVYYISGKIDEFFKFQKIIDIKEPEIVLDLEGFVTINSIGIRGWLEMNKTLGDRKCRMRNLPFFFVNQLLMIYALRGKFVVESLKLPYFCETCDDERQILFKTDDIKNNGIPENMKCSECDGEMEFDEAESIAEIISNEWCK